MENLINANFIHFLLERNWIQMKGNNFYNFSPPAKLDLPYGYKLKLPLNSDDIAYEEYLNTLLDVILKIYGKMNYSHQELDIVLSNSTTVLSYRIHDEDTRNGTINLNRHYQQLTKIKELIKQAATFALTNEQILASTSTNNDAEYFVNNCRSLQTSVGSFITRIEFPTIGFNRIDATSIASEDIANKLYDGYNFTVNNAVNMPIENIDKIYLEEHKEVLNIQLVDKVRILHETSKINNADIRFTDLSEDKIIHAKNITSKIKHLTSFVKKARSVALKYTPLDVKGKIVNLTSYDTDAQSNHRVVMRAEIDNKNEEIILSLTKAQYKKAVDAHVNGNEIHVVGFAESRSRGYSLTEMEKFEIK